MLCLLPVLFLFSLLIVLISFTCPQLKSLSFPVVQSFFSQPLFLFSALVFQDSCLFSLSFLFELLLLFMFFALHYYSDVPPACFCVFFATCLYVCCICWSLWTPLDYSLVY